LQSADESALFGEKMAMANANLSLKHMTTEQLVGNGRMVNDLTDAGSGAGVCGLRPGNSQGARHPSFSL
jgi:hypothetical protein